MENYLAKCNKANINILGVTTPVWGADGCYQFVSYEYQWRFGPNPGQTRWSKGVIGLKSTEPSLQQLYRSVYEQVQQLRAELER